MHWQLKGKHKCSFSEILRVILEERCHSETEHNGTDIFTVLSELFLIATQSNTFPLSIDKMEVHIFRAYARAELLVLGTGDVSGQITLCCGGLSVCCRCSSLVSTLRFQ